MPKSDLLYHEPKELQELGEVVNTELKNCREALAALEKNAGGDHQGGDIVLVSSEKGKSIDLPGFGAVTLTELRITGDYLFLQAEGKAVKFNHIRMSLIRREENPEIIACQRPQVFLKPNREITPEDLTGDRLWAEALTIQGELEMTQFIGQTLTHFVRS